MEWSDPEKGYQLLTEPIIRSSAQRYVFSPSKHLTRLIDRTQIAIGLFLAFTAYKTWFSLRHNSSQPSKRHPKNGRRCFGYMLRWRSPRISQHTPILMLSTIRSGSWTCVTINKCTHTQSKHLSVICCTSSTSFFGHPEMNIFKDHIHTVLLFLATVFF